MPLDELLQVISRLRERAQQHQVRLGASEAQTRYSLIDPLLRALGWDTEDPTQVRVEESTGAGTADYALLDASGKAHMYLEAKRLGRPLSDGLAQGINHCLTQGTLYFVVTDGLRWEIYETHKPVPLEQKRVVAWDIGREDPAEVAKKARTLWRPNILRQTASAPVESSTVTPTTAPPSAAPAVSTVNWITLDKLQVRTHDKHPKRVRLPDGSEKTLDSWRDLLYYIASYLVERNHITAQHMPIPLGNTSRYIMNTTPEHEKIKKVKVKVVTLRLLDKSRTFGWKHGCRQWIATNTLWY